jgi:hypothetical protein
MSFACATVMTLNQMRTTALRRCSKFTVLAGLLSIPLGAGVLLHAAGAEPQPRDPITRLAGQLERGEVTLEYREGEGYLRDLLKALDINVDSQTLVFSKTSFQQAIINPRNPRAVYFNDEVSVGTVPGGDVHELLALEPGQGMVFYSMSARKTDRPRLQRRGIECLFCHAMGNKGAPSLVVASVVPDPEGTPAYTSTFISTIDHRTPLEQRWGGWYVTGTHGSQTHQGNAVAPDPLRPLDLDLTSSQNLTSLEGKFDLAKHLTGTSDIVALMTLEHQVGIANRINALNFQYNRMKRDGLSDEDWKHLDREIDDTVAYMLFLDEAPIREPIKGVSTFTQTFQARGPRDRHGRSLRDFDLETRLFKHPLSFMVYSELFDGAPKPLLDRIYEQLFDVLTGEEDEGRYAALAEADRKAVLEILVDTKPNLPPYFTATGIENEHNERNEGDGDAR